MRNDSSDYEQIDRTMAHRLISDADVSAASITCGWKFHITHALCFLPEAANDSCYPAMSVLDPTSSAVARTCHISRRQMQMLARAIETPSVLIAQTRGAGPTPVSQYNYW